MKELKNTCIIKTGFVAGTGLICSASGMEYSVIPPGSFLIHSPQDLAGQIKTSALKAENRNICIQLNKLNI